MAMTIFGNQAHELICNKKSQNIYICVLCTDHFSVVNNK